MSTTPLDLSNLLDNRQVKQLLASLVEFEPQLLFVTNMADELFAQAVPTDLPAEIIDNFPLPITSDFAKVQFGPHTYHAARTFIEIQGQQIGYVVSAAPQSEPPSSERLIAISQLLTKILSEQAYKELELQGLSTELINRYEELTLLYEMSQALGSVFDITTICDIALQMAIQVLASNRAFIALMDDDNDNLSVVVSHGMKGFTGWKIPVGQGITGHVAFSGEQVLLDNQEPPSIGDTAQPASGPKKSPTPTEATLSVPLILSSDHPEEKKGVLGVITMAGKPPGEGFSAGDAKLLTTLAAQVATAIHNSQLVLALREAERVQQQIRIAAQIQQSLLPKSWPQIPGLELAGKCVSAANVGGDYYDFLVDDDNRLTMLIADASGHSVGSALMMVTARSRLRYEIALGKPLRRIVSDTNRAMFDDLSQAEMFLSMFCARFDPVSRQFSFVNGGHNFPMVRRASTRDVITLDTDGLILGVLEDVVFEEKSIVLDPGDIVLLYTDGVVEARTPHGELFGEDRLKRILIRHDWRSPEDLTNHIYQAIYQYTENAAQQDDITLLILQVF